MQDQGGRGMGVVTWVGGAGEGVLFECLFVHCRELWKLRIKVELFPWKRYMQLAMPLPSSCGMFIILHRLTESCYQDSV